MALSSVGSMRHSRARRNRTSGCEGVSGTRVRIRDHTEPWFFDRSIEPEEKFLIFRSKESIGWLYAGNVARRGGMQYRMLRGRLERVYRPESPAGQAGFYADKVADPCSPGAGIADTGTLLSKIGATLTTIAGREASNRSSKQATPAEIPRSPRAPASPRLRTRIKASAPGFPPRSPR